MPDAAWAVSGISQADPGGRVSPRFRHFRSGSLALASLNRTCQNLVPTFPQRSPPWLLTTAACGGLRSTPDCRTRRTFLHLPYSCASPCGPTMLVTQGPTLPTCAVHKVVSYLRYWRRSCRTVAIAVFDPIAVISQARQTSIRVGVSPYLVVALDCPRRQVTVGAAARRCGRPLERNRTRSLSSL